MALCEVVSGNVSEGPKGNHDTPHPEVCIQKAMSNKHLPNTASNYLYCCTVNFEDSVIITHQQMH